MQSYRYNDLNDILNEATTLALNKSMDLSSRVDEERMKIDETVFEQKFKEQFQKSNVKVDVQAYDFDYLKTDTGYLKAVKIKVTDDEDTTYQTTYVTNTTNTTDM